MIIANDAQWTVCAAEIFKCLIERLNDMLRHNGLLTAMVYVEPTLYEAGELKFKKEDVADWRESSRRDGM